METAKKERKVSGLFRTCSWKKNLLNFTAGFLLCLLLIFVSALLENVRGLSQFNPAAAIVPLIGFSLGIWGAFGFMLCYAGYLLRIILQWGAGEFLLPILYCLNDGLSVFLYCILPFILWYCFPLKGEKRTPYPRMDTAAHVVKFYLIMLVTVAVYVLISMFGYEPNFTRENFLLSIFMFLQYLDVVLIAGIPLIILISLIRHRTLTINERMVLAFLIIGVVASMIGAFLLYQNTKYLDPRLFDDFDSLMTTAGEWTGDEIAAFRRYNDFWDWYFSILALMLNALLIVEMLFMRRIEKKVTRPILHLADVLEQYTQFEEGSPDPQSVAEQCRPYRYGYGEVSNLTRTCVNMVGEIDSYTENLRLVTAEKERIGTELDVASKIQRDMLPGIFPPFPDRPELELFASMTPAREVGGDFYDFYFIDRDHLALTIADVSGKGVPASLFMVISKTLLQTHAQTGCSPKEILTYVNHQLCQNNQSFMFCTVWLGILDVTNGKLTAANAGHEYPAIRRKDGQYELIRGRHDPPLGLRDGLRYREYELVLSPGDCLFQYTDGVTEATDSSEELFGEDRLIPALNKKPDSAPEEVISRIYEAVQDFVKEAPQFDDITMLCLRYLGSEDAKGQDSCRVRLKISADVGRLDEVTAFVGQNLEKIACPEDESFLLSLAAEELFVNIASYAYDGREGETEITFSFDDQERMVSLTFADSGIPFDPTGQPAPDITQRPGERPVGGLGIHIVKQRMDEVTYEYAAGKNLLTIRKRIESEQAEVEQAE